MLESFKSGKFLYEKLSKEEQDKRGILGRLEGPIADFKNPTRNGRLYSEPLWEKVFEDPIMKEKIANRCCFGELGHPEDRQEVDMEKIAICLAEQPKKSEDGNIYGVFDILNTPNGKILKALCDYGCNIGVSSRGTGDLYTDDDGNEAVDPETYECECWDAVLIPAVESARMNYVTESLNSKKSLKQALKESLDSANDEDKEIMKTTLNELGIDVEDKKEEIKEENDTTNEEDKKDEKEEAVDDGSNKVVESLKEAIKEKARLEKTIKALQEKLAVSDTKVNSLNEELGKYKNATTRMSEYAKSSRELSKKVSELEGELNSKDKIIENLNKRCDVLKKRASNLNESVSKKVDTLDSQVKSKEEEIKTLKEELEKKTSELDSNTKSLNESLKEKEDKIVVLEKKINESLGVANKYKRLAQDTVNRYIESKATMLGVNANEIKNKLNETYTINDIDRVCEELKSYQLNMSKLPFHLDNNSRVKVKEAVNEPLRNRTKPGIVGDDDVDESLIKMAGLTD